MHQTPQLTMPTNQFNTDEIIETSIIKKLALITVLVYIFLIPWGNVVWDGFIRAFGIAALGLSALVIVLHGTHKQYSLFNLFFLMFGCWVMLTLLWSPDIVRGQDGSSTIIQLVAVSFIITLLIDTKDRIRMAYQAYVFGACVGSAVVFYNYLHGIEAVWGRYGMRNYGPDGVGIIIALGVPMAAYLTTQYKSVLFRVINSIAIPICMFGIFLNATRTASIVAMFGIAYWLFTHRKASLRIKVLLMAFFISSVIGVLAFAPTASVERVFSSGKSISSGTLNGRTAIWRAAILQWESSPIIGMGIGSFRQVVSNSHIEITSAHNTYIHILTELGLIGLFLYLFIILSITYYLLNTSVNHRAYLISFLLVATVSQLTMNTLYDKEMWFALTMLAIHAHKMSKHSKLSV